MSLKAFHIFFITLSILLSIGLGTWGVRDYMARGASGSLTLGVLFLVAGFVLIIYGRGFLKKMQEIEA